jgi:hypothetical protein
MLHVLLEITIRMKISVHVFGFSCFQDMQNGGGGRIGKINLLST